MLGGRASSRQCRYTQAASTYVFGSHGLCLYLHSASSCRWGYRSPGGMDVLMCPKEMASPPQARAAGLIERERWMMGGSAPQLPASQPAASSQQPAAVEPRFRGSFRPRRLEDRAYLTTATSGSIVHCHQPHSLVLSGNRATLGAWGNTTTHNPGAHPLGAFETAQEKLLDYTKATRTYSASPIRRL